MVHRRYFDALEVSLAARFDRARVDYIEQGDGDELSESLLSPPALVKYAHSEHWTSRLSAGRGYRAPLSFFESDHGLLDDGYDVAIDALEGSLSLGYSLNYTDEVTVATLSAFTSVIDELAFIDFDAPRPRLLSADESARVDTFDIEFSHQLSEHWSVGGGAELFIYDRAYRSTFGVVPIEERTRLFLDYAGHDWSAYLQWTWVGARDLSRYGTGERYNILNPDGSLSAPKKMRVPVLGEQQQHPHLLASSIWPAPAWQRLDDRDIAIRGLVHSADDQVAALIDTQGYQTRVAATEHDALLTIGLRHREAGFVEGLRETRNGSTEVQPWPPRSGASRTCLPAISARCSASRLSNRPSSKVNGVRGPH